MSSSQSASEIQCEIIRVTDSLCSFIRSKNDLAKQLADLKHELLVLRVQKIAGGAASKLTKMCVRYFHL